MKTWILPKRRDSLSAMAGCGLCCGLWLSLGLAVRADDSLSARRDQIEQLTPEQKLQLQQKKARFESLTSAEQQRLRDLHGQLEVHAGSDELMQVLRRYDLWLSSLPSGERARLLAMPPDERIQQIRKKKREFEESLFGQLSSSRLNPDDVRLLFDWLDKLIADQEDGLRGRLDPRTAAWLGKIPEGPRRRFMILGSLLRERGPEGLPQPSAEQIDTLVKQLSVEAQEKFRTQTTSTEQQALVRQWIQIALLSRWLPPPVSEKELQRFFVEDLSAEERESLERRPRDELSHELRRRYFHYQLRRRMPDGDFGPGGPPGRREGPPGQFGPPFEGPPPGEPWGRGGPEGREPRRRGPPREGGPPPREEWRPDEERRRDESTRPQRPPADDAPGDSARANDPPRDDPASGGGGERRP